jgi:SAM-dependent methyltransferase
MSADYLKRAIQDLCGLQSGMVLDWGCGLGQLVQELKALGFDAYGCDQNPYWVDDQSGRLRAISVDPYVIPFDGGTFDVVVSTSVLEHAQNKVECFRELHRVLRPGGCALHIFPGKWYLPTEPHLYVPLANFFWPNCPRGWLAVWAMLGVRNQFQKGQSWKEVARLNADYCCNGISYWTGGAYERLALSVFGNFEWPMDHFIEHAGGGVARLARKLPFRPLWGRISREIRVALLLTRK